MDERNSFIFYRSFYESIRELPKDIQADVYDAICALALDGKEIEMSGIAKSIFILIKPQIEANNKRYASGKTPKNSKSEAKDKRDGSEPEAKKKQKRSEQEAKDKRDGSKAEANEECRMKNVECRMSNVKEEETNKEEETDAAPSPSSLFESFEAEFARPLSPIEIDLIAQWESEFNADVIRLALAEGVKNNARSLRYIEVILKSWKQAGVRTAQEAKEKIEKKVGKSNALPKWYDYEQTEESAEESETSFAEIERMQKELMNRASAEHI